jgi:hypothetical protein
MIDTTIKEMATKASLKVIYELAIAPDFVGDAAKLLEAIVSEAHRAGYEARDREVREKIYALRPKIKFETLTAQFDYDLGYEHSKSDALSVITPEELEAQSKIQVETTYSSSTGEALIIKANGVPVYTAPKDTTSDKQ